MIPTEHSDGELFTEFERKIEKDDTITELLLYLPTFLVMATPIHRLLAIYLVPLRCWSRPWFFFLVNFFL